MQSLRIALMVAIAVAPAAAQAACKVESAGKLLSVDLERGRRAFLKCRACHTVKADEANLVGPNLSNLLGRGALAAQGFDYSAAFTAAKPKWTVATLDKFIEKPAKQIPGTKMVFAGIAKPQERADLMAWLARESGSPMKGCN